MPTGKQKAAMLLMSLDPATAAELLRGMATEGIQDLALELARIDASEKHNTKEQAQVAREFYNSLREKQIPTFNMKSFCEEMLVNAVGKEKAEQIQSQIKKATMHSEMFADIRSAGTDDMILALKGEHPQTIAVVLSELPPKKSQEVLSRLDEDVRLKAVCRMTNPDSVATAVLRRIASIVSERLKSLKGKAVTTETTNQEQNLRKLAVMLCGLEKDLRDQLLGEVGKRDEETGKMIKNLMVTWQDIPSIADRSIQEALRTIESGRLAVALYAADEDVVRKIRSNISERAAAMLDEEASLMQEPAEKEILLAREEVLTPLRQANDEGKLKFVGR